MGIDPTYRLARVRFKEGPERDRIVDGLRKAGIPD
jgi:hypothetical protein